MDTDFILDTDGTDLTDEHGFFGGTRMRKSALFVKSGIKNPSKHSSMLPAF